MTDCVQYAGGVLSYKKLVNSLTLHEHLRNFMETPVQSSVRKLKSLVFLLSRANDKLILTPFSRADSVWGFVH